jgi:hypothetical protein
VNTNIENILSNMNDSDKEALIQGIEFGIDYRLNIDDVDYEIYKRLIEQK